MPSSRLGEGVELGLESLPTLGVEHRAVGGSRGIKGEEPPAGDPGGLFLLLVPSAAHNDLTGHRERRSIPSAVGQSFLNGRKAVLDEVRRVLNGITNTASPSSAASRSICGPSAAEGDGRRAEGIRTRVEKRGHQGV